jgi:hypothetical protein
MPKIVNNTTHPFRFPKGKALADSILIPRGEIPRGASGDGAFVPGTIDVSDEDLKAMREHPVAKGWFGQGKDGRFQLTVDETKAKVAAAK